VIEYDEPYEAVLRGRKLPGGEIPQISAIMLIMEYILKTRKAKYLIFGLSVILLFISIVLYNIPDVWIECDGNIIEWRLLKHRGRLNNGPHSIQVRYSYKKLNGKTILYNCNDCWSIPNKWRQKEYCYIDNIINQLRKGDTIKVWYNPNNHYESTCDLTMTDKYPKTRKYLFISGWIVLIISSVLILFEKKKD